MVKTKVTTLQDIKKEITVKESWLSPSAGLELLYSDCTGEHFFVFTPAEACRLLKLAGLINDYYKTGDGLIIQFDYCITPEDSATAEMPFQDFAQRFRFSQYDAICTAAALIREMRLQELTTAIITNEKRKFQTA